MVCWAEGTLFEGSDSITYAFLETIELSLVCSINIPIVIVVPPKNIILKKKSKVKIFKIGQNIADFKKNLIKKTISLFLNFFVPF